LQLSLMLLVLVGCVIIGAVIGSHLLGAFVAGLLFVNVPRSHLVWQRQLKQFIRVAVRFFFFATVAFSIKLSVMFTLDAFWKGLVVGLLPTIVAKLIAGVVFTEKDAITSHRRWLASLVVGAAMVGRGEFAYYVAEVAATTRLPDGSLLMPKEVHAIVLWALIISSLFAPLIFQKALQRFVKTKPLQRSKSIGGGLDCASKSQFAIRMIGRHHTGVMREILNVMHDFNLDVIEIHAENDGLTDVDVFTVEPRGDNKNVDDETLKDMCHSIEEVVDDPKAVILFEPLIVNMDDSHHVLEIELIGEHHPDVLHETTNILFEMGLEVSKAYVDTTMDTHEHSIEVDVFYAKPTAGLKLSSLLRAKVREALSHVIDSHHLKGEVLVKVIHESECRANHGVPSWRGSSGLTMIICDGPHQKNILHEICDFLSEMQLEVYKADVHTNGGRDSLTFYVDTTNIDVDKNPDVANSTNPVQHTFLSKENTPSSVEHIIRAKIRKGITELYVKHESECTVYVRPFQGDGDSDESVSVLSENDLHLDIDLAQEKPKKVRFELESNLEGANVKESLTNQVLAKKDSVGRS